MKFIPAPKLFSVKCGRVFIAPVPLFFVLLCLVQRAVTFNIDTNFPLVISDPSKISSPNPESYFGYTIQFLSGQKDPSHKSPHWLLVGAPKANSSYSEHGSLVEPGVLYSCSINRASFGLDKCSQLVAQKRASESSTQGGSYFKGIRNNGWLGGALSVNSASRGRLAVCAHRWTNSLGDSVNGACYWSDYVLNTKDDFYPLRPLVQSNLQLTPDKRYNYGRGQAGFSVHMAQANGSEEMIIGAPGVFDWTGSVIRVSDDSHMIDNPIPARRRRSVDVIRFGRTVVGDVTQLNQLQPYDYFGYSVYSGHFFSDGSSSYVGGAPRGADMKGKVLVFDFVKDSQSMRILLELTGTQLGEYYGASLLAASLNMDGLDELLVGAPQHSLTSDGSPSSGDEGRVYVYVNQGGVLKEVRSLYGNQVRGARFGSTISLLGDINRDNFNDIAIGAPYEHDRGAVYIYLGGKDGLDYHPVTKYWQRISPSDFPSLPFSLRGFGISISTGSLVQKGYPDLAIGSYLSGHAVILRTKPVVQFGYLMTSQNPSNTWKIAPHEKVDIKACFSYSSPDTNFESKLEVYYEFFFDAEYMNNPRLFLETNDQKYTHQPFNFTQTFMQPDVPVCRWFALRIVTSTYQDFSKPAKLRLTANLIDGGAVKGFCAKCPVRDEKQPKFYERTMSFTSECGADEICQEDLEVQAHFSNYQQSLVIGSRNQVEFEVNVKNHGEPSYVTRIDLFLPVNTHLKLHVNDQCKHMPVGLIGEFIYSCKLSTNPLKTSKSEITKYVLDVSALPSGLDNLTIVIEARVGSGAARGQQTMVNLTLPLRTEIDLEVLGSPPTEQRPYQLVNGTRNATRDRFPLEHGYEIRNIRSSPADEIDVEILFPVSLPNEAGELVPLLGSNFTIKATQKGSRNRVSCNISDVLQPNDRKLKAMIESINKSLAHQSQPLYNVGHQVAMIDCLNSKNARCVMITCTARSVIKGGEVGISVSGTMLLQNTLDYLGNKDDFIFSSVARVSLRKPTPHQHPNHKQDVVMVLTHVLPQGPPAQQAVASWILALSILAGVALLSLAAYGLHKIGFFKRQRIPREELMHNADDDAAGEIDRDRQPVT